MTEEPNNVQEETKDTNTENEHLSLDQIHEKVTNENEELFTEAPDDEPVGDEEVVEDEGGDSADVEEDVPEEEAEEPEAEEVEEEPAEEPEKVEEELPQSPRHDPVEDEELEDVFVEIKDSDGTVHKVKNLDDLPNDFEPASYKDLLKADKTIAEAQKKNEDIERRREVKKFQDNWNGEIESLAKEGKLPENEDERRTKTMDVFSFMANEDLAGRPLMSFTHALTLYELQNGEATRQQEAVKAKKEVAKVKKKAGGKVMGSGRPSAVSSQKGNIMQGPPSGVSLDQVHSRIMDNL